MSSSSNFEAYASKQRKFWSTEDEWEATFARVDTVSAGDETRFRALAESTGELLANDLSLSENPMLLEVGCGVGRMIQQMQKRVQFRKLYGVDISETMIGYARKNIGNDPRVSLRVNTGYDLSVIPSGVIDYAYSVDVFIHIFDAAIIANYLREVHRALKPGGTFRFDVRCLNLNKMFANSIGGQWARLLYKLGLRRADMHRWRVGEEAGFNGNKYRDKDLRATVTAVGFTVISTFVRQEDSHLWCLARKK